MCDESSNNDREAIARRLNDAGSILTVTHARPDGDALGSSMALVQAATAADRKARMLVPSEVPARYAELLHGQEVAGPEDFDRLAGEAELIVILDTCALAQLDGLDEKLPAHRERTIVVDHHRTPDDIGSDRWIDTSAAAAGVMVWELLGELGWKASASIVEALCWSILTDTGWLRFSNADARCLRIMAELIDAGAELDVLYQEVYQRDRPERLTLLGRVLDGMQLHCDGRVATMRVRRSDFEETGATPSETENFVNEALRVQSVEAAIFLSEQSDEIRVSLRSRGGVDVSDVASQFGGGGHVRAAGCRREGDLEQFESDLLDAICRILNGD